MGYLPSAQTTDSQPATPVITFQVNLETVGTPGWLQPNRTTTDGNETVSEASNMKNTRTIWIPGLMLSNYEGVGGVHVDATGNIGGGPGEQFGGNGINQGYLHHGQQFTVKGLMAVYLKKTYVTGSVNDVLQIVSES